MTGSNHRPSAAHTGRQGGRSFTLRRHQASDTANAVELYRLCFQVDRSQAVWEWKCRDTPANPQVPFHVAEAEAGLMGLYPTRTARMQLNETVRLVPQCHDVCIHPNWRGGRIVRALLEANEAIWPQAGVPFAYGFPTEAHRKFGARTMGYKEMFPLLVWRRPLTRGLRLQAALRHEWARRIVYAAGALWRDIAAERRPKVPRGDIRVAPLAAFDDRVDQLWERVRTQVRFAVVRDAAYLRWRYLDAPGQHFQILGATRDDRLEGYCVFRDGLTRPEGCTAGAVMDLVSANPETAYTLLEHSMARMRAARCGYALALAHPDSPIGSILATAGFEPDPGQEPIILITGFYSPDFDPRPLKEPSNWLLTYGDTDHLG